MYISEPFAIYYWGIVVSEKFYIRKLQEKKSLNIITYILIKLLEDNLGRPLYDINHSNIILNPSPRIVGIKAKINKWKLL